MGNTAVTSSAIEEASKGIVPLEIFSSIMPVMLSDARFVAFSADQNPQYTVQPNLSYVDQLQFSTKEQALAIVALIEQKYPGSTLQIFDNVDFFSYPGFRKLQYFNAGDLRDPRVYKVNGSINLPEGLTVTEFNVGWLINVKRILNGGSSAMETGPGWPEGNTVLRAMNSMGLAQPIWVGGDKQ